MMLDKSKAQMFIISLLETEAEFYSDKSFFSLESIRGE